jgi:hypothetical protein
MDTPVIVDASMSSWCFFITHITLQSILNIRNYNLLLQYMSRGGSMILVEG